ncbi:MAG: aspartate-semialdehyde dehydrogenase [Bacteroidetes bacterium]|nr:aspartate-semialdehyde dehydrogenase [Bacteroidota bacterium]MCL1968856.1 aspartate-semialdehyde dehydrogenase [Bacteroidota bacterium]
MSPKKISVIGATGLVGSIMLRVLEERNLINNEIILAASEKSVGKKITIAGKELTVVSVEDAIAAAPDFALFSAGSTASLKYAPLFAQKGTVVIDNSSAWRSFDEIPLVVPQINGDVIKSADKIIANPNCSTIQMVMALAPLHQEYGLKRVVVSTYQSVTGTGAKALNQLLKERVGEPCEKAYPHQIDMNLFPHGGTFEPNGYTTEEMKLVYETRKILRAPHLQITSTVVRVPVIGGHSEAINAEFEREFDITEVFRLLKAFNGITVLDNPMLNEYPMPLTAHEKDEVFVGRIRRDESQPKTLNLWCVADNLRKGAATNAVEIMEVCGER